MQFAGDAAEARANTQLAESMPPHTCCAALCCCLCPSPDVTRWQAACSKQSAVHDAQLLYHDLMSPPSCACVPPGLVFYDPKPRVPSHAEPALGMLFALQLVWALFPFMYTAFLQSDRQYYATDAANGLYRPSVCALVRLLGPWCGCFLHSCTLPSCRAIDNSVPQTQPMACTAPRSVLCEYHTSCHWVLQMFPAADEHGACWLQTAPLLLWFFLFAGFPECIGAKTASGAFASCRARALWL